MASDERIEMLGVPIEGPAAEDGDGTEATTNEFQDINLQAGDGPANILRDGHDPKSMWIGTYNHQTSANTLLGLRYACRQTRVELALSCSPRSILLAAVSDSRTV